MPEPIRISFEYDDDLAGAADALLAVLRPITRRADVPDPETDEEDDETADAA
ncbi:MAG: hypothetical protein K0Q71_5845 [Thermomicrobiales bacterium]|jgi:hypothetical protein|nr:hypothetical protein [Thermomicrobiales bacterium]